MPSALDELLELDPGSDFFAKADEVAVINCSRQPRRGVFFGALTPRLYQAAPGEMTVLPFGEGARLLHLSSPFAPAENGWGRPAYLDLRPW